jgi:electron transport complex protein RnfB
MRMWIGILIIAVIALVVGIGLSYASSRLPARDGELAESINDILPQTQCAQCGFPGCRPYATAIVAGEADINLCPPGGDTTIRKLAELLARDPIPLAEPGPTVPLVAVIDESLCIGCFHCRDACPVDAIIGAHQLMHTVIASECTGCELCVAPCPVDCISMSAST